MRALIPRRLPTSLAAAVLLLAGTVGALAANAELPDQVSDTAKSQLADLTGAEGPDNSDDENGDDKNGDVTTLDDGEPSHSEVVSTFARETELEGCERGQAVAAVARGDASPEEAEAGDYSDPCDNGDGDDDTEVGDGDGDTEVGDDTNGDQNTSGQGTADDRRGEHGEDFGRATADERSGGKAGSVDDNDDNEDEDEDDNEDEDEDEDD
ncbi:MAG: hypothetical protein ACRDUY_06985 [Nitriliruptorales bacterium]